MFTVLNVAGTGTGCHAKAGEAFLCRSLNALIVQSKDIPHAAFLMDSLGILG